MQQDSQTLHLPVIILLHSNNILFDPITKLFLIFVQVSSLLVSCINDKIKYCTNYFSTAACIEKKPHSVVLDVVSTLITTV